MRYIYEINIPRTDDANSNFLAFFTFPKICMRK